MGLTETPGLERDRLERILERAGFKVVGIFGQLAVDFVKRFAAPLLA